MRVWGTDAITGAALDDIARRNTTVGRLVMPFLVAATALALLHWHPAEAAGLWALAYGLLAAIDALIHARLAPRLERAGRRAAARPLLLASFTMMMGGWASIGLWAWVPGDAVNNAFLIMILCITLAVIATAQGASFAYFAASAAPVVAVMLTIGFLHEHPLQGEVAALLALDILFMLGLAVQSRHWALATVRLRQQKADLVARLGDAVADAEQARERAESASRAKSTFLAGMSHEIRTPLNAILGFSEVIRDQVFGPVGTERYIRYAADIHQSGTHLLGLINDILDLSRIEAGKLELRPTVLQLSDVFEAVSGLLELRARDAQVSLDCRVLAGLPGLWADERLIRQVLINLVANGLRFTPPGGGVVMAARLSADGGLLVAVSDTGVGIPPDDLARVTDIYTQAHRATSKEQTTGLGLSIVKGIAELHGARLDITSRLGEGTHVEVRFPPERTIAEPSFTRAAS